VRRIPIRRSHLKPFLSYVRKHSLNPVF
jgi:hypothetical protein